MSEVKPITPRQAASGKQIPDAIIQVFNDLIAENYNNGLAKVTQDAAIRRIEEETGLSRAEVFDKGWLDVEGLYEAAGWNVTYDKPGYNETYGAFFIFKKRRS